MAEPGPQHLPGWHGTGVGGADEVRSAIFRRDTMAARGRRVRSGRQQPDQESFSRERALPDHVQGVVAQRVGQFGQRHRLSVREEQIFLRLVLGNHPKAIGASLGCEYGTVRTHIRRMQKKLGCTGTRELLVRFISEL